MTTKELRNLLTENRNITINLNDEWKLTRNLDSMGGSTIYISNEYNVDKSDSFSNENKGIKFFMSKVSYAKSFARGRGYKDNLIDITIKNNDERF